VQLKKKAENNVVIDTNPDKFELAKELGATDFVNRKDTSSIKKRIL